MISLESRVEFTVVGVHIYLYIISYSMENMTLDIIFLSLYTSAIKITHLDIKTTRASPYLQLKGINMRQFFPLFTYILAWLVIEHWLSPSHPIFARHMARPRRTSQHPQVHNQAQHIPSEHQHNDPFHHSRLVICFQPPGHNGKQRYEAELDCYDDKLDDEAGQ